MEPQVTAYAGMLDQSCFKQWYGYQKMRIDHHYEAEEVSFLMSKPPFYFRDYEMLSAGSKLTCEDQHVLSEIFHRQWIAHLDFEKDDSSVFEKRLVRVRQVANPKDIVYHISIPWTVKGNASKLTMRQEQLTLTAEEENEIRMRIELALNKLAMLGFFRSNRLALEIYHEVEERCQWSSHLRPAYVKDALYQQIGLKNLILKTKQGRLYFQDI